MARREGPLPTDTGYLCATELMATSKKPTSQGHLHWSRVTGRFSELSQQNLRWMHSWETQSQTTWHHGVDPITPKASRNDNARQYERAPPSAFDVVGHLWRGSWRPFTSRELGTPCRVKHQRIQPMDPANHQFNPQRPMPPQGRSSPPHPAADSCRCL